MIGDSRRSACARHRGALLALVDRRERGPSTDEALDHLGRCARCEADLTAIALTINALRRIGADAAQEPLPDGAWTRLRARIERSGRRARETAWRWRLTLGGIVTSTLIVAVLVGPVAIDVGRWTRGSAEPTGYSAGEIAQQDRILERAYGARTGTLAIEVSFTGAPPSTMRNYPDGIRPERKEVDSPRPSGQGPEAS